MAYIGRNPAIGTQKVLDSLESQFNGSKVTFDLRYSSNTIYPPIASALIVSLGGVLQEPGTAYTVASDTITFASAPTAGTDCWILLYTEFGGALGPIVDLTVSNNLTVNNDLSIGDELHGPANFVIDPAAIGDNTGTVEIKGNLTVQGTTTTINSTTVDLDHLSLGDNEIANFGDSDDLEIYHNGSNSVISHGGAGNLSIKNTVTDSDIVIQSDDGSGSTTQYFRADGGTGEVKLYHYGTQKFATTSTGVTVTGTIAADGFSLQDNETISFGEGADLQIYHNGSNSYIQDSGTGALIFKSDLYSFRNDTDTEQLAKFIEDGAVELYYDNSKKIETTSTGVDITGLTDTDTLNVSGSSTFNGNTKHFDGKYANFGNSTDLQIVHDGNNSVIQNSTGQFFIDNNASGNGIGDLFLRANDDVVIRVDGNDTVFTARTGGVTITGELEIAEKIIHTGDTNTHVSFPSSDYIRLTTSNSSRLNVTPNGYILLGLTSEPSGGDAHARNARLLIQGRIGNTADSGRLNLQRGSTASNGSSIGSITFTDNSNNAYARIETLADAAPGTNDYPGRIVFSTTPDGSASPTESLRVTSAGYVSIPDDSGRFTAGSSNDLQIYHDGSNSYVEDVGTGALIMKGSTVRIRSTTNENMLSASQNGAISLYYDNDVKLETTFTGVDVLGGIDVEGGDIVFDSDTESNFLYISRSGSTSSEFTRISRGDTATTFFTKNDEATSTVRFRIQNTDTESGGGANANDRNIDLISDQTNARILIDGNKVWHAGNDGSASGLDADTLDGLNTSSGGDRWGVIPFISGGGVLEGGRYIDFHNADGSVVDYINRLDGGTSGQLTLNGNRILTTADEGSGNGLDADTLDGQQGSYYTNAANLTGTLPAIDGSNLTGITASNASTLDNLDSSQFIRSDANDTFSGNLTSTASSGAFIEYDGSNTGPYLKMSTSGTENGYIQFTNTNAYVRNSRTGKFLSISSYISFHDGTGDRTIWHEGNDGPGSGLNADQVDNLHASSFLRSDADDQFTGTITASSDGSNPIILVKGNGPNFIRFASDSSGTVDADSIDFVYRSTPNTLGFERSSDGTTFWTTDADTGVTNFNYTPTVSGSSIFDASNLNAGTISDARIPDIITPVTRVQTAEIRANGTQLVLNAGEAAGQFSGQTTERIYLNSEQGVVVSTSAGDNNFQSGWYPRNTIIDGQGIHFYMGGSGEDFGTQVKVGEITSQDGTWLRINQTTAKNIYTPRYIRADGGFFVDGTAKGINGSGNFIGGTIAGASDYGTLLRSDASDTYDGSVSGRVLRFASVAGRTANTTSGNQFPLEVFQSTQNADAAMTFHVGSDHARYFGVDGTTNDLFTGGWSVGATKHKIWHAGNDGSGSGLDADLLDGHHRDAGAATANTVAGRNGSGDIHCRLIRQTYQNQSTISGGMVYRVNNGSDNYLRVCNSPSAIRTFLGISATGGDANYLNVAGDTATGTMTFNGVVNIRSALDFADADVLRMGSSDDWTVTYNNNGWNYINQKQNGIIFQDDGTAVMRLEDSGTFRPENNNSGAIGQSNKKWNIVYAVNVRGQSNGSPGHNNSTTGYAINNNGSGYFSRSGGEALYCNRNQNGGIVRFGRSGTEKGQIVMNTNSVSYQTTSDYRLKENVVALENGIDRVKQLKPYRFNFIDDPDETLDGFLAHEAQEVVHECASGTKDEMEGIGTLTEWDGTTLETDVVEPDELTWEETITDEEGNETTQTRTRTWTQTGTQPVHQGIDQAKLVPLLTAALQEAITKIEQLEARITQLEST